MRKNFSGQARFSVATGSPQDESVWRADLWWSNVVRERWTGHGAVATR